MSDQQGELHSADGAMIRARRDLVVGGVLVAAILVLVLSGWRFIGFAQRLLGHGNDATQLAAGNLHHPYSRQLLVASKGYDRTAIDLFADL